MAADDWLDLEAEIIEELTAASVVVLPTLVSGTNPAPLSALWARLVAKGVTVQRGSAEPDPSS